MPAIAALLSRTETVQAVRRALPRGSWYLVRCRSAAALERAAATRVVDAVVFAPTDTSLGELGSFRRAFPRIPRIALAPFRPDHGSLLLECREEEVATVLVEGVENAVAGEVILRLSAAAERGRALADGPRMLRLTDPIQRRVWVHLLERVDLPVRTATLARQVGLSREHLSREFGAGGAPNLKRVIDLTRVACAAALLQNPGYDSGTVARVLGFASASHLSATARRIASVSAGGLAALGPRGVLAAFARGNTRSRL